MAHETYLYRGALEPKNTQPATNEIQFWRGAVEPAELGGDSVAAQVGLAGTFDKGIDLTGEI